jgi:hypothetical protein
MSQSISAVLIYFFSMLTLTSAHASLTHYFVPFAASCGNAVDTDHPGFCSSFKTVAVCYCINSGLPPLMCQDMDMLYARLISVFGSIQKACEYQKDTSPGKCMDDWHCFHDGMKNAHGKLCSSTGKSCRAG